MRTMPCWTAGPRAQPDTHLDFVVQYAGGISKEKMQRACGIAAVLSIQEGLHLTSIDPEEHHDRTEVDIEALIRKIEGEAPGDPEVQEEQCKDKQARRRSGSPSAPLSSSACTGPSGSVRRASPGSAMLLPWERMEDYISVERLKVSLQQSGLKISLRAEA